MKVTDMRDLMQKTGTSGCQREDRVEPEVIVGAQTYMGITENTFTSFNCREDGLLEFILSPSNLNQAYRQVVGNRGAGGVDGMEVEDLLPYLRRYRDELMASILAGSYRPNPVRRVEIPKGDGKKRALGIPTVVDRVIQQAIAQVLSPMYETQFSDHSYGFRPGRSAHQALRKCKSYIERGCEWAVDLDLEKFFDTVNHSKLIEVLSRTVKDGRVVSLIHRYLNAGVMVDGVREQTYVGVPQSGPLSPLLSNIMLNELDKELERRDHRFVRYADDLVILCRSKRAGERILAGICTFIERKLLLKVNWDKTQVVPFYHIKFLSHGFNRRKGIVGLYVHPLAIGKLKAKLRELTCRSNGWGYARRKFCQHQYINGWVNYFRLASMLNTLHKVDGWLRRRIRMCIWKSWSKVKTRCRKLIKLVPDKISAIKAGNSGTKYWRMAKHPVVMQALSTERLRAAGYPSMVDCYERLK